MTTGDDLAGFGEQSGHDKRRKKPKKGKTGPSRLPKLTRRAQTVEDGDQDGKLTPEQLGAIGAAATGLIGGIGALTLTGALGRVQRNHGIWFAVAVGLVLLGAAIVVGSPMIQDSAGKVTVKAHRPRKLLLVICAFVAVVGLTPLVVVVVPEVAEPIWDAKSHWITIGLIVSGLAAVVFFALAVEVEWKELRHGGSIHFRPAVKALGTLLVAAGLIIGFVVAIAAAGETEQPTVTLALSSDGAAVTGTAKVGDLGSGARLNVFIDGLTDQQNQYEAVQAPLVAKRVLYRAFIGPNSDGGASDNVTIPLPPGQFDAIAITAYTTERTNQCGVDPPNKQVGTGCAIIRLPDRSSAPDLAASWVSHDVVNVNLQTTLARESQSSSSVLLRATGLDDANHRIVMYTGMMQSTTPTLTRHIRISVPSGIRRICVDAQFATPLFEGPLKADCPLNGNTGSLAGESAIELKTPAVPSSAKENEG